MKFIEIVQHAIKLGYKIDEEELGHKLILERDEMKIELHFPDDDMEDDLDDGTNISWEYRLSSLSDNRKVHYEFFDYYIGNVETKIRDMQTDILKYVDGFAIKKIKLTKKSVIKIFGIKLLNYKELEFE